MEACGTGAWQDAGTGPGGDRQGLCERADFLGELAGGDERAERAADAGAAEKRLNLMRDSRETSWRYA